MKQLGSWEADEASEAVHQLWGLWYAERGPAAQTELIEGAEAMASAMNDRHAAEVARERFVGLIDRFPGWGEPLNKLATLEYLLGDYAGAARLCHDTLAIKPHHFGALSGLVQCELARGDLEAAQNAAMRLHNLQPSFAADLLEDIRARRQGRRRGPGSY